jgi:hypothetical protein
MSWRQLALAAAAGLAILAAAALLDWRAAAAGYLAAWLAIGAAPIGAAAVLAIGATSGGRWSEELRPGLAATAAIVPLIGLLLLPVVLAPGVFYPWAQGGGAGPHPAGAEWWMSHGFFLSRSIGFFVVWTAFSAELALRGPRPGPAAAALIFFTLASSLMATDWAMSLDPRFASSGYGLKLLTHQLLAALALAVAPARRDSTSWPAFAAGLVICSLFWAYFAAMQYIVIWSGDLPDGIAWYLRRGDGPWPWLIALLALAHATPIVVFLFGSMRRSPAVVRTVALILGAARLPDAAWLVLPEFEHAGPALAGLATAAAALALCGLGGAALKGATAALGRRGTSHVRAG